VTVSFFEWVQVRCSTPDAALVANCTTALLFASCQQNQPARRSDTRIAMQNARGLPFSLFWCRLTQNLQNFRWDEADVNRRLDGVMTEVRRWEESSRPLPSCRCDEMMFQQVSSGV